MSTWWFKFEGEPTIVNGAGREKYFVSQGLKLNVQLDIHHQSFCIYVGRGSAAGIDLFYSDGYNHLDFTHHIEYYLYVSDHARLIM